MPARLAGVCLWLTAALLPAADWSTFTQVRGNFRAAFPAQPQESVQTIDSEYGPIPYTTLMAEVEGGQVAFGVAYHDYPATLQPTDPQTLLDAGRDGARQNLQGTIVSEIAISWHGHPGREFTILGEAQGQKLFYHSRLFLVGQRLYQLQIVRVGTTPLDLADAVRFFSSFEQITPQLAADPNR